MDVIVGKLCGVLTEYGLLAVRRMLNRFLKLSLKLRVCSASTVLMQVALYGVTTFSLK